MIDNVYICTRHDTITNNAQSIMNYLKDRDLTEKERNRLIKESAKIIFSEGCMAKIAGQSMEDRLVEYKNAIECLGFKRSK